MSIPVDPRYTLRASGNVEPISEWGQDSDGKRTRLDTQATSPDGVPLWAVEVLRQTRSFGQDKTVAVPVEVASRTMPAPEAFAPLGFQNLTVDFFVRRGGTLGERWAADGLADADTLDELLDDEK